MWLNNAKVVYINVRLAGLLLIVPPARAIASLNQIVLVPMDSMTILSQEHVFH